MMNLRHILGLCPLCALPVAVGTVVYAGNPAEVCRRLVDTTRQVDRLLRTVCDQESGKKVAAELSPILESMHREAGRLSQLPVESADEARVLERAMRDLMHITQGYMPVVQRLNEVNAYGAEELMQLFRFYKMDTASSLVSERRDDTPLIRAYGEYGDSMEDVIYLLRRVSDAASAAAVLPDLRIAYQRMRERVLQVMRMEGGLTPQQVEVERMSQKRLETLRVELSTELLRVLEQHGYGVPDMETQLSQWLKDVRS